MRASALLVLHIIHILIFISHLSIIYFFFFHFFLNFNFRVGLVGLWLFLILHRGFSTTPTPLCPYNTKTFLQTVVPSIPSKSCCCFLWNTSGAKHNLSAAGGNGVSQRGCWLCIKVGSIFQGTCQNLADIFSIGKYLALDSCSKTFTLVGSKKCSLFFTHIYIIFGPTHMWKASFFPPLWTSGNLPPWFFLFPVSFHTANTSSSSF